MYDFFRVVILSYNHPEITHRCVKSVLALGFPSEWIILVHNGSDRNFVQYLQKKLPPVQHFILERNSGFTGGANAGIRLGLSQAPWVYFLTNDTEALNLPTQAPREPALIAPIVHRRKASVIASRLGLFDPRWGQLDHLHAAVDFAKLPLHGYLYAPGAGFLIAKEVFQATGGFDEFLHTYWEDVDLSVRTQRAGFQVKHEPKLNLIHFVGKTCHKKSFYTTYLFQRNRKIVSFRYLEPKFRGLLALVLLKDFCWITIKLMMSRRWKDIWLLLTAYLSRDFSQVKVHAGAPDKFASHLQTREWIQPIPEHKGAASLAPLPGPIAPRSSPPPEQYGP